MNDKCTSGGRIPRLDLNRPGNGGELRSLLRLGDPLRQRGVRVRAAALRDQPAGEGAAVGARQVDEGQAQVIKRWN